MEHINRHHQFLEPAYMDTYHRKPQKNDSRTARECSFCQRIDPEFACRRDLDRLVLPELDDTAGAHISEDGYVLHRIAEMRARFGVVGAKPSLNVA
jgi:hypothetical protein